MLLTEHSVRLATGEHTTFEVDESIPYGVAVLIVEPNGTVNLTRQYRYAIDRWIYDLPGGAGNPGEDPASAAARESREETGLEPVELVHLHTFYPNPGRSAWPVHLYFATTSTRHAPDTSDPSEQVSHVTMTVDELDTLIRRGEVVDPGLLIARSFAGIRGLIPALK